MKALKSDSLFSGILADEFRQLLEQFRVLSFYETRPLGRFGIVNTWSFSYNVDILTVSGC